ncbi:MAG: caspase family protein [Nitrososphaerales archaeon]
MGDYSFEVMHPLDSTDDAHDFSLKFGDVVGFNFEFNDAFPGGAYSSPWPGFGVYADIIIASPVALTKWALIIGINDYGGVDNLRGAVNDAKKVYNLLLNDFNFPKDKVRLLTDEVRKATDDINGTRETIINALNWLRDNINPGDLVVIYISAHGGRARNTNEPEYIVPHTGAWISDNEFATKINEIADHSPKLVVILDVSFSGGFIYDGGVPANLAQGNPVGRIVLTACDEALGRLWLLKDAHEWPYIGEGWEGVFTHYFLKAFKLDPLTGKLSGDFNNDSRVTVEEAFKYASIWRLEYRLQRPQMYDGIVGDVYFGDS